MTAGYVDDLARDGFAIIDKLLDAEKISLVPSVQQVVVSRNGDEKFADESGATEETIRI